MDGDNGAINEFYVKYNGKFPIYATQCEKSIQINRVADNSTIASTFIRDLKQVVNYEWDSLDGKYISVIFRDGSIRINDAFQNGKLIAFLRTKLIAIDCAIWSRIVLPSSNELKSNTDEFSFNHDILQSMPRLVKFIADGSIPSMVPYTPANAIWRKINHIKEKVIDLHMLHQKSTDTILLMLNGEYTITIANNTQNSLCQILYMGQGVYNFYYQNGYMKQINMSTFLCDSMPIALLETILTMKDYFKYLSYHLNIIDKNMIKPYFQFISKICDGAYGYSLLNEHLTDLILVGEMQESLKDWFMYSVGEKNLLEWESSMNKAYNTTIQIMIMCIIPACERLIILTRRAQSILLASRLIEQGALTDTDARGIPELDDLILHCQTLLGTTIDNVRHLSKENNILKTFLLWVEDNINVLLKSDFKPQFYLNSQTKTALNLAESLEILLENPANGFGIMNFEMYNNVIKQSETLLDNIDRLYAHDILLGSIDASDFIPLFSKHYSDFSISVLDIQVINPHCSPKRLAYVVKSLEPHQARIFMGIIDSDSNNVVADIQIPYPRTQDIAGVRIITPHGPENTDDKLATPDENTLTFITRYRDDQQTRNYCHLLVSQSSLTLTFPALEFHRILH